MFIDNTLDADGIKNDGTNIEDLDDEQLDKTIEDTLTGDDIIGEEDDKEEEKETPTDSSSEEKTEDGESSSSDGDDKKEDDKEKSSEESDDKEKKLPPFHEHPRFKQIIKERDEAKHQIDELNARLEKLENPSKPEEMPPIPAWFAGDEDDWKQFIANEKEKEKQIISNAINAVKEEQTKQQEESQKWDNWVNEKIQELEYDENIPKFNRNELIKVMLDYKPTDDEGNLDFNKGINLLQKFKSQTKDTKEEENKKIINKKKQVAAQTMNSGKAGGNSEESEMVTAADIRHKSFGSLL